MKIDSKQKDIVTKIYEEIFKKINENYVDVFLCGGASNAKEQSDRDKVMAKLNTYRNIRIHYPEDLFMEMLKTDKTQDLMSLESFLADNSDYICIICESAGSLVELGAFTNNEKTVGKVIAAFDERRKNDESFIMMGPAAYLKKRKSQKKNIVYYSKKNIDMLVEELSGIFGINKLKRRGSLHNNPINNTKPLNSLIGLYYFILLILFFYKQLTSEDIANLIKYLYRKYRLEEEKNFDTLFQPSIKLLQKHKLLDKHLYKEEQSRLSSYTLTEKGYNTVNDLLDNLLITNRTVLYDRISFDIMLNKYYT
ncbi:hypothetical protein GCM10007216_18640 [Thalassobacillus devorans]|uniref:Uncharacterized protein n=1 Tax=Thalassobacillus devorans TaxID=279813 RepID=A0ABQ1P103_9BACI|nr:retron St85 family effector protein [Thalassobacillus devorans]NIK28193.1 hypothetical protein [Thalassobacillus devorans]GGC88175.1 hypothetical protein GCM10007216_18640 [Thalassobacillus devorans]